MGRLESSEHPRSQRSSERACLMCAAVASTSAREAWDTPILESESFVVIPSVGSLVEGWLLIVPRSHILSIASLEKSLLTEFNLVKAQVKELLAGTYGLPTFFEHGPAASGKSTGCTVDHAHMHAVSLPFDLVEVARPLIEPIGPLMNGSLEDCGQTISEGRDYVYIEQPLSRSVFVSAEQFPSQLMRKAVALGMGMESQFDWRNFPFHDNVARTVESLRRL